MSLKIILSCCIIFLSSCTKKNNEKSTSNETVHVFKVPDHLKDYYRSIDFGNSGKDLYNDVAILTIAKHTKILEYWERHAFLYNADADPSNDNNVILLYSEESTYKEEYMSSSNNYETQTFNTEHVYPQSYLGSGYAKGDLHHLRACNATINSNRSNLAFTDGSGTYKIKNGAWYPGDEWRGDVARMLLYVNLRYDEPFNSDISTKGIELFLKWNAEDPVSPIEIQRNNSIEVAQGNRNPFIDNPYLATVIFNGTAAENRWTE